MWRISLVISLCFIVSSAIAAVTTSGITDTQAFIVQATQGSADAQYQLGTMYLDGKGVSQNNTEAAKWFRKAAEQGDADSQAIIAAMYDEGLGVPKSRVSAYQWATLALSNPSLTSEYQSDLQKALTELTAELTSTEIAEAEKLVKQWEARSREQ